jgi:hypothetical protein
VQPVTPDARTGGGNRPTQPDTGALETPLGPLAATGGELTVTGMDTFVLREGRIAEVWAVADLLGALAAAGAVAGFTPAGISPPGGAPS